MPTQAGCVSNQVKSTGNNYEEIADAPGMQPRSVGLVTLFEDRCSGCGKEPCPWCDECHTISCTLRVKPCVDERWHNE